MGDGTIDIPGGLAGGPGSGPGGGAPGSGSGDGSQSFKLFQLTSGMRFGPCVTVKPLGRGGMGEVWLARNVIQERDEAVKVLLAADAGDRERERFIREAKAAMEIGDVEEIVKTYDIDEADGRLYIRMEYVRGVSLDKIERPPPDELVPLFQRLARALAAGHRKGIIHRDIKPSNYMIAESGAVKLMDFGLARARGASQLTLSSDAIGTPAYMSIEQWESAKRVDARADVYSLGVTFYKIVAGRLPYDLPPDAPHQAYLAKLYTEDPHPLPKLDGAPAQLENLVLKAMAKDAAERFADATELSSALDRILSDPGATIARPTSLRTRRRRRRVAVAVALAAALGGAGAGTVTWYAKKLERESVASVEGAINRGKVELGKAKVRIDAGDPDGAFEILNGAIVRFKEAGDEVAKAEGKAPAEAIERVRRAIQDGSAEVTRLQSDIEQSRAAIVAAAKRKAEEKLGEVGGYVADVKTAVAGGAARRGDAIRSLELVVSSLKDPTLATELRASLETTYGEAAAFEAQLAELKRASELAAATAEAEKLLAREEFAAAFAKLVEAVRHSPRDEKLRDLARYAAARVPGATPAGRIVVPPVTTTIGGRKDTYVPPFAIDTTEVTNLAFKEHAGAAAPTFLDRQARWPVTGVTLAQAATYAKANGGRLPKAQEWEVAAGFDPKNPGAVRVFPWGDKSDAAMTNVGAKDPLDVDAPKLDRSALGVVGLGGNVREWLEDGFVRGGHAWQHGATTNAAIATPPLKVPTDKGNPNTGFRCAYDLPEPKELAEIGR